ncbi:MAG: molecular chaperone DnaJ [Parcubacteria group bacterium]|jgi:molecular chaperone DnaJ|nr:molecular chaperone DnaJ [Parcubacteria group bacterium]
MSKDYYQILGVNKGATQEEIKKSYYKLAHEHHPHKGGDESKMKEVNEAYGVLGNDEKRQQYDQFGQTFDQAKAGGGMGGFGDFSDFAKAYQSGDGNTGGGFSFNSQDLGDMFGDLFGGGARTRSARVVQGADIEIDLTIDFQQAVFGVDKELKLNKDKICDKCKGEGGEPGSKVTTCKTCKGTGQVVKSIGFGMGFPSACPTCDGQGKTIEKKCTSCHGKGVTKEMDMMGVKIPAGIDNGQTMRLAGKGQAAPKGGRPGDLYLRIRVLPDPRFHRDGSNIKTKSHISFSQAALGDKIEIETIDGKVKLKIPEGTQSGKIFSIKGKGVQQLQGRNRGDHLVEVIVETPSKLNRKQKQALKDLDS